MSAICGVWRLRGGDPLGDCDRILGALQPYGRDRSDSWSDGVVGLGSRLTRLVPEDAFDRQPIVSEGGRYAIVADARIDDRESLSLDLGLRAGDSAEMSD